jgi:ubiquinone biosynthesis O-methyltransferase
MLKTKPYHQFTAYDLEPGGLKKLDFIVDMIQNNFPKNSAAKILDVGCGLGNIVLPLTYLGYQVTAIDENQEAIKIIEKKNKFSNLILNNVKFEDYCGESRIAKFDVVIMSEFLEHVHNPEEVLQQVKKILNNNGMLILTVPNGRSLEEWLRRFFLRNKFLIKIKKSAKKKYFENEIQTTAQSPHLHFWSLTEVKKLLTRNGFVIVQNKNYVSLVKEFYYIFGRFFIKRGSKVFHYLDRLDNKLADLVPLSLGSNWIITAKKKL